MGCCSSTQNDDSSPSDRPSTTRAHGDGEAPHNSTRQPQSADVYSPSSSRAPLTLPESPRQSAAHRRPSTTTHQSSNPDVTLSSHYNLPLLAPKPWKSSARTWTREQLDRERQDFFDTRVTGRQEVWDALRQVSECIRDGDLSTAQGILDAANITLPTGRLEDGAYDERGALYRVSHAVLCDPLNVIATTTRDEDGETVVGVQADSKLILDNDKQIESPNVASPAEGMDSDKAKAAVEEDTIKVRCRSSNTGSDTIVDIGKTQVVAKLHIRLNQELTVPSSSKLRIFYLGKELEKRKTLEDQGYVESHVLNVFVTTAPG